MVMLHSQPSPSDRSDLARVTWSANIVSDAAIWTTVRYDVESGSTADVYLELDPHLELVSAQVDAAPARVERAPDGRWRIDLGASYVRRTLVLHCRQSGIEAGRKLTIPRLSSYRVGTSQGEVIARRDQHVALDGKPLRPSANRPDDPLVMTYDGGAAWPVTITWRSPARHASATWIGALLIGLLAAAMWGLTHVRRLVTWLVWPANWLFLAGVVTWLIGFLPAVSLALVASAILVSLAPIALRLVRPRHGWSLQRNAFQLRLDSTWYRSEQQAFGAPSDSALHSPPDGNHGG